MVSRHGRAGKPGLPRRVALRMLVALAALTEVADAARAEPPLLAVFDFSLVDTSPSPPGAAEIARIKALGDTLRTALAASGRYRIADPARLRAALDPSAGILHCNGCERSAAQALGAPLACYGWVQKVSELILNINLVIEDAATGAVVRAGSVDIRGNTDESWQRGLRFLLDDRILGDPGEH